MMINNHIQLVKALSECEWVGIYGYGYEGKKLKRELEVLEFDRFIFVCTHDGYKQKSYLNGVKIETISELNAYPNIIVIISQRSPFYDEMDKACQSNNIKVITIAADYQYASDFVSDHGLILNEIESIKRKLSMKNDIWRRGKIQFYVPNYPCDYIQRHIVDDNEFFEQDILKDLETFLPEENPMILDIGANIGNHSLYWAFEKKARIIAFEPVENTFNVLKKNIEINKLKHNIKAYNFGLSDVEELADYKTFREDNIGDTHLISSKNGSMKLRCLDSVEIDMPRIDMMKIDVEDYEAKVLLGAKNTIKKFHPLIFVESYPNCFGEMNNILMELNYEIIKEYEGHNFLYKYKS